MLDKMPQWNVISRNALIEKVLESFKQMILVGRHSKWPIENPLETSYKGKIANVEAT